MLRGVCSSKKRKRKRLIFGDVGIPNSALCFQDLPHPHNSPSHVMISTAGGRPLTNIRTQEDSLISWTYEDFAVVVTRVALQLTRQALCIALYLCTGAGLLVKTYRVKMMKYISNFPLTRPSPFLTCFVFCGSLAIPPASPPCNTVVSWADRPCHNHVGVVRVQ